MPNPARRCRVAVLFGTRPEAIKLAPVIRCLQAAAWAEPRILVTGQHREMLDSVLAIFAIQPDRDLNLMQPGQSLIDLVGRLIPAIGAALAQVPPDLLLVQGDTTSAFAGALAAAYAGIPIGHVEAGLRSFDRRDPFPEEINRRLIAGLTDLHFAPTDQARRHLLAEGIAESAITVTGNTVVDALQTILAGPAIRDVPPPAGDPNARLILVTLHRRESWGAPMAGMCTALRSILDRFPDTRILFPMHRNPVVRQAALAGLGDHPRAALVEPLDYLAFVKAMSVCHLIVTDSGGIQEEAPVLGKPVLVLRDTTERPEAIAAGTARLVGTAPDPIAAALTDLLSRPTAYAALARATSPFGDGRAAERIVEVIRAWAVPA